MRVLSVEGPSLKRWDVAKGQTDPKDPSKVCRLSFLVLFAETMQRSPQMLRIAFDHGLDGKVELSVSSEV